MTYEVAFYFLFYLSSALSSVINLFYNCFFFRINNLRPVSFICWSLLYHPHIYIYIYIHAIDRADYIS
jgi:hypothetical protein